MSLVPNTNVPQDQDDQLTIEPTGQLEPEAADDQSYSLVIRHPHMLRDNRGRLGTNEELLKWTGKLASGLAGERPGPNLLGGVLSTEGGYEQDLYWDPDAPGRLFDGDGPEYMLVNTISDHSRQLAANARCKHPVGHRALHIPDARFGTLIACAHILACGARVTLRRNSDGEELELTLPEKAHLDALPKMPRDPHQVVGQLTGVGREGPNSCRLEINKGKPIIVQGMSVAEACEQMLAGVRVTGTKVEDGKSLYLQDAVFERDGQDSLDI